MSILTKIFGDYSEKELKRNVKLVDRVFELEPETAALSDEALQAKTAEFRERYAAGETLEDLLPEAFAVCREAAWRVLQMKHFRVQVEGGIILHQGRIAEMKTGEGKTLVATLPAYLNAITGKGVHIVTVNEYLARRDSEWMGKVYKFLGLTVGLIYSHMQFDEKQAAYNADITYGTNSEFGFDYLRDNMVPYAKMRVQRGHVFAIVDEVDSILIDEARTPLIISGLATESSDLYRQADDLVRTFKVQRITELDAKKTLEEVLSPDADYVVDEKARTATLTKNGIAKAESFFGLENLMDPENLTIAHHVNQAIKARGVMRRDVDYVVREGQVFIVDEFTGRVLFGRRYNEGLHQAIEAKEGVNIQKENRTVATITYQNFFRLYKKLSGMTGTAMTENTEFNEIYSLDVVEIPTNRPMIRVDHKDALFPSEKAKLEAVIKQIEACHAKGQPVLVGTVTIEKSEEISKLLHRCGIKHEVLNAKQHEREAEIVAQAGKLGAVTIATNMAGRGTDIILGGNAEYMAKAELRRMDFEEELIAEADGYSETSDEDILEVRRVYRELVEKYKAQIGEEADQVRAAGGLFIIGTVRHESRRIDNQLRGRSGRQGDPGESRFYISTEDDILRLFGSERIKEMMARMMENGNISLESKVFTNGVEAAQKRMEENNFAIRKNVLQYDDVMNTQRTVIYQQRNLVLDGADMDAVIRKMIDDSIETNVRFFCAGSRPADWNRQGLHEKYFWLATDEELAACRDTEAVIALLRERALERLASQIAENGEEDMQMLEQKALLKSVDSHWMDHLENMEQLKRGIGLRAYAQHDPVVAFRQEGFEMFESMIDEIREETILLVLTARKVRKEDLERKQQVKITNAGDGTTKAQPFRRDKKKVGRNDECPCGSGKKYKKCCGRNAV